MSLRDYATSHQASDAISPDEVQRHLEGARQLSVENQPPLMAGTAGGAMKEPSHLEFTPLHELQGDSLAAPHQSQNMQAHNAEHGKDKDHHDHHHHHKGKDHDKGSSSDHSGGSSTANPGDTSSGSSSGSTTTPGDTSGGSSSGSTTTPGDASGGSSSGSTTTPGDTSGGSSSGSTTTPGDTSGGASSGSGFNTSGLQNILSIPGDTAPKLTNNTFGSGALKSASLSVNNGTVTMTEAGANADEMWYSHYADNGGNTINDQINVTLPSNLAGVHAVEMGSVLVRNGNKDEFELQFKPNGNGTDTMSVFVNDPKLGPHGGWSLAETVPGLHAGANTVQFSGQILNGGKDLQFTQISINGQNVALPPEFQAGSAAGWGLAGQVDQHMQIDNNSSTAPVTTEWTVSSTQTP